MGGEGREGVVPGAPTSPPLSQRVPPLRLPLLIGVIVGVARANQGRRRARPRRGQCTLATAVPQQCLLTGVPNMRVDRGSVEGRVSTGGSLADAVERSRGKGEGAVHAYTDGGVALPVVFRISCFVFRLAFCVTFVLD